MLKRTLFLLLCTVGFGLTACGDDLGDKQASELTSEERTEVCEELADYANDKISDEDARYASCVIAGEIAAGFDTTGMTTCEDARDQCLAEPEDNTQTGDCSDTEPTDCTATVDEIRNCNEAQIDASAAYLSQVECGAEVTAPTNLPSECDTVLEKCPDFFGGDDTQM